MSDAETIVSIGEKGWDPRWCCDRTCGYREPTHRTTAACRPSYYGVGAPCCAEHACPTCEPLIAPAPSAPAPQAPPQVGVEDDYRKSRDLAIAAQERGRIVAWMRTSFPQNRHAQEWADAIERHEDTKGRL